MLDRATFIGRARIRASTADTLALQTRSDAAVRALDLDPPGMPSRAILCIRTLDDPMPGGIDVRTSHAGRATAWERAARNAVESAYRRAVRPALGMVPAAADAVLFADRAELLACAARDACRGLLSSWWWTHVLRSVSAAGVVREWVRVPLYVPAALAVLAAIAGRSDLVSFVREIPPGDASALLSETLTVHAATPLARAINAALIARHVPAAAEWQPVQSQSRPPWSDSVPEIDDRADLTVEQRLFSAVALALRRAPVLVRGEFFARETISFIASSVGPRKAEAVGERRGTAVRVIDVAGNHSAPMPPQAVSKPDGQPVPLARTRGRGMKTPELPVRMESPASEEDARAPRQSARRQPSTDRREQESITSAAPPAASSSVPLDDDVEDAESGNVEPRAVVPIFSDTSISSDYAGVFFLLNVAIALRLYDPYGHSGQSLDVWDFLALISRAFDPAIEADAVWPLLASLANREEGEAAGAHFIPPDEQPFEEWLATLVQRVTQRLEQALPVEHPAAFLIRRYGRVGVTAAHLDIFFSLAAHPIEIRLAGLDRDPGWVPAAGRHVAFRFE